MRTVRELLEKCASTLWHVHPSDTVYSAIKLLADYEIGALMVMDAGVLVGVTLMTLRVMMSATKVSLELRPCSATLRV